MYLLFALLRFYPYWALPLALVIGEIGVHLRRRKSPLQKYCWAWVGILGFTTILWFAFRGDVNSDKWVKALMPR